MGDYRNEARRQLKRAQDEMASGDDQRIKYAALELREAMESLTYDRALAYKDEFPPQEYETWQPKKVMAVLLDIDPLADKDSSLAFGIEPSPGEKPEVMHSLGSEKVLSMKTLKKHYDALGSFLHVQSLKQRRAGVKLDYPAMRKRCENIVDFLGEVLRSPVWNSTIGTFATLDCENCGKPIRKRFPPGQDQVKAKCHECGVTYAVKDAGENQCSWKSDQTELTCANVECGRKIVAYPFEIQQNVAWTCPDCSGRNVLRLAVFHTPEKNQPASKKLDAPPFGDSEDPA